ncbi:unnamed protein product [Parajaminaea phylloscopi]
MSPHSPQLWRQSRLVSSETLVEDDSTDPKHAFASSDRHRWSVWTANSTTFTSDASDDVGHSTSLVSPPLKDRFGFGGVALGIIPGVDLPKPDEEGEASEVTASSRPSSLYSVSFTPDSSRCALSTSASSSAAADKRPPGEDTARQPLSVLPVAPCAASMQPTSDAALDATLASTMLSLERANSLLLSTMDSRAQLARLRAMQSQLDGSLQEREEELLRQIEHNRAMSRAIERVSAELDEVLTSQPQRPAARRSGNSWRIQGPTQAGIDVSYNSTHLEGIVEAQDSSATIGKSAAKRLEKMLQGGATGASGSKNDTFAPALAKAGLLPSSKASALPSPKPTSDVLSPLSAGPVSAYPVESAGGRSQEGSKAHLAEPTVSPDARGTARASHASPTNLLQAPRSQVTPKRPASHILRHSRSSLSTLPSEELRQASRPLPTRSASVAATSLLVSGPSVTSSKSRLSDAFGLSSALSQEMPITAIAECSSESATPVKMSRQASEDGGTTPAAPRSQAQATLMQFHKRTPSSMHSRTPSVIKPSTVASSEWTAFNALASPNTGGEYDGSSPWQIVPPVEEAGGLSSAKGRGALAALKLLNQQTASGTDRPEKYSKSPTPSDSVCQSGDGPAACRGEPASRVRGSTGPSQPASSWNIASWMGLPTPTASLAYPTEDEIRSGVDVTGPPP